jgi:hypothetical protein
MSRIKRQVELDGWDVQRCTVHAWGGDVSDECLDWQPSQFINIVGKDDVARSGSGGGRYRLTRGIPCRWCARISLAVSFPHILKHSTRPPTLG